MSAEPTAAAYDPHLGAVVDAMEASGPLVAFQTALRTRSKLAERAVARLASPELGVEELLAAGPDTGAVVDPGFLCALAGLMYSQTRYEDAFALYSLAERRGATMPPEHQKWYARSALHIGEDLAGPLERLTEIPETDRLGVEADAAHPSAGGDVETWLERFRLLTGMEDLRLTDDESLPLFDRLTAGPLRQVSSGPKISIIMTCFQPGPELRTAIRSVLEQTWQNWELLLVDDCSGPEYHETLAECEALDPRIRLLVLPRNCGTYVARNHALAQCSGRIVTGLDSDDWAHPAWLERQSLPIRKNPEIILSISSAVRAFEDLTVCRSSRSIHSVRSTSIMFRLAPVRKHMGFFDEVRKGADTEFRMRFASVFGDRAIKRLTKTPMAIVRLSEASLTSSEFGMGWIHPYRWAYQSAQKHWHQQIRRGRTEAFIHPGRADRPFFAPAFIRSGKRELGPFDEVHVADCRYDSDALDQALRAAADAADRGRRVGLLHQESLLRPLDKDRRIRPSVLETLHRHDIAYLCASDEFDTARLVVAERPLWEGRESEYALRHGGDVEFGSASAEPHSSGPPTQRGRPTVPPPRPEGATPARRWTYRKLAAIASLAVVALLYALSAVAWLAFGPRAGLAAGFAAVAATLFLLCMLATEPGFRRLLGFLRRKFAR